MAVAAYTTELNDITTDGDAFVDVGEGGVPLTTETDFFIQGSNCCSKPTSANWDNNAYGALAHDDGAGRTIPTSGAVFAWIYWWGPGVLATEANGGAAILIGASTTDYKTFEVRGSDTWEFGGWECVPVDPNTFWASPHRTVGTGTQTYQWFGFEARVAATVQIGKGNPMGLDAIRYGRGELRCTNGDVTNGYASFGGSSPDAGAAAYDNAFARRWGLLTPRNGAYFQQGLFIMGLAGTAVDFRDSNRVIFIQNTKKVASAFNGFETRNASSNVLWTNISVQALGTVSRGYFLVTAGTVTLDTCTFTDMDTFTFLSSTSALNCTFRRCNAVTAPGSDLSGSGFRTPTVAANTSALVWNVNTNPNGLLDNTTFSKGTNAHHAIEFGTSSPLTMTLTGIDFSGFSASQNNNASIFHIKRTSGAETVTINLIDCSSDVSFATSYRTDGAVVVIVQDPVTFSVTAKNLDTGAVIENARVMVPVTNGTNFPYQASVTITSSGTTATVTHTGDPHGLADNDNILIAGADQDEYNGAYTIDVTGTYTYTYTMLGDPADDTATGTITATMVLLNGFTNASGVITDSRTYSADQTVSGWVRRHTYGPSFDTATWTDVSSTLTKTGAFTGMSGTFLITITAGTNMTPGVYLATWVNANDVTLPGAAGSADSTNVEFAIGARPLYRQAPVVDLIPSSAGKEVTVFLQPDE